MINKRLLPVCLVSVLLLAGCANPTPALVAPTMTNVPTLAPSATALPAATMTPAPSATYASRATATALAVPTTVADDLVPAGQINDAKQARLRLAHLVEHGPNVDLYLNGSLATNGRMPQANLPPGYVTGYLYLPPGTYHVAVTPAGQGLDKPLVDSVDVSVVPGHRYTLALMGQFSGLGEKILTIDETATELKAGAVPTDSVRIWVANLDGGAGMDVPASGYSHGMLVPYGQFAAVVYPAGNVHYQLAMQGYPGEDNFVLPNDDTYWNEPGSSTLVGFMGPGPDDEDSVTAAASSDLSTINFLQSFSGKQLTMQERVSFDTLLAAIKTAGLTDTLNTGGPYLFFAPTDAAFAALPKDKLDTLLADPQAIASLLRGLIVPGYFPVGTLSKSPNAAFERSLTNLLGGKLVVGADFTLNGADTGSLRTASVANGNQVHPISKLVLPAAQ